MYIQQLNHRQLEILRLVSEGEARKRIANRLCITHNTVRNHMTRVFEKLGATTSAHAVAIGFKLGYLRIAPDDIVQDIIQDISIRLSRDNNRRNS